MTISRTAGRRCDTYSAALQLLWVLLVLVLGPLHFGGCHAWPWSRKPKTDISSAAKCRAASNGRVYQGDSIYPPLQEFFKVNGPLVQLPTNMTDITTAATIIQLAVPELKLVLDPLLFLKAMPAPKGIPKVIFMTTRTKHMLAPHQILSIISWGWYNRGYSLLLFDNEDITTYMKRAYPGFIPTYVQLKTAVEKSDAWRYHILCNHGGVYADTDTICARPVDSWTQPSNNTLAPGLIVGIENLFHSQQEAEEASYVHKIQVTQWTMAAKKHHPVVCRMGTAIKAFVDHEATSGNAVEAEHGHDASILLRTGPGIWSKEVHSYLRQMGSSPEAVMDGGQVEDLVVLPQAAFGCNFRYWTQDNNASLVYHMFNNSWKVDHYKVAEAKKLSRQAREQEDSFSNIRSWYLVGAVMSAAACSMLVLVLCLRWCGCCSRNVLRQGSVRRSGQKNRPYALSALSSPHGSPKGSPKHSPVSSPYRQANISSCSASTLQNGRQTQQRQVLGHHLSTSSRKSARLLH